MTTESEIRHIDDDILRKLRSEQFRDIHTLPQTLTPESYAEWHSNVTAINRYIVRLQKRRAELVKLQTEIQAVPAFEYEWM